MYQKHVADGSTCHGENHPFLPDKERYDYSDGYKLREPVVRAGEIHIPQAVDDEKAEDGRCQHLAEVVDDPGDFFPSGNRIYGRNRVRTVPRTATPMVMNCWYSGISVMAFLLRDYSCLCCVCTCACCDYSCLCCVFAYV